MVKGKNIAIWKTFNSVSPFLNIFNNIVAYGDFLNSNR